jgi:hypothetical protein
VLSSDGVVRNLLAYTEAWFEYVDAHDFTCLKKILLWTLPLFFPVDPAMQSKYGELLFEKYKSSVGENLRAPMVGSVVISKNVLGKKKALAAAPSSTNKRQTKAARGAGRGASSSSSQMPAALPAVAEEAPLSIHVSLGNPEEKAERGTRVGDAIYKSIFSPVDKVLPSNVSWESLETASIRLARYLYTGEDFARDNSSQVFSCVAGEVVYG